MGLNVLVAAFNKYGFGKYTYKLGAGRTGTGTQVDCSALVQSALKDSGYSIGTFNTNNLRIGLFSQATGSITDYAKQYFDVIPNGAYQPGDVVVYRNINGGPGHVGVFYGYDAAGLPIFYGSQASTGPAIVDAKTNFWRGNPMELVGVLRPKDGTHTGIDITIPPTEGTGLTIPNQPADPNLHYYRFDTPTQQRRLYDNGIIYIKDTQTGHEFWSTPTETGGQTDVNKLASGVIVTQNYLSDGSLDTSIPATLALDANANADVRAAFDKWVAAGNDPANFPAANIFLDDGSGTAIDGRAFLTTVSGTTEVPSNDVIIGDSVAGGGNMLLGGLGNDLLIGGKGNDALWGGGGNDVMAGGDGDDTYILDGGGADTIEDKQGNNRVLFNGKELFSFTTTDGINYLSKDGAFTGVLQNGDFIVTDITSTSGDTVILNQNFASGDFGIILKDAPQIDRTLTGDLAPIVYGKDSNGNPIYHYDNLNNLVTDPGTPEAGRADWLYGDIGNDLIMGKGGGDILYGSSGDDRLYADSETPVADAIALGNGQEGSGLKGDWLTGGDGDDTLVASAGNDVLYGGSGADLLIGRVGDDDILGDQNSLAGSFDWTASNQADGTRVFSPAYDLNGTGTGGADTIYAGGGADHVWAGAGGDAVYGEGGADRINGEEGNDTLFGGADDDTLWGGADNDYLDGGEGNDQLIGEAGNDILIGGNGADTAWGGDANDYITGDAGNDVLYGDNGDGGTGDDTLLGGDGNDILWGEGGNDQLIGGLGDDNLYGGEGANYLDGGDGNDLLNTGGSGNSLFGGTGDDILEAAGGGSTLDGEDGADTLTAVDGTNTLFGGAGDDNLSASGGNNYLDGGDGANLIVANGLGGNTLIGGTGADTLSAEGGNNYLDGGDGANLLTANGSGNTLIAGSGNDTLSSLGGNGYLDGGDGNDLLIADTGGNTLSGGACDDNLSADGGNSYLDAGAGSDGMIGEKCAILFGREQCEATNDFEWRMQA